MTKKISRNDPCWCGSGLKYKKCHDGRADLERINPFDIEAKVRKHFSSKYCLHPLAQHGLCKGDIIRAHTIQRTGGLDAVAENNHVYGFKPSFSNLKRNNGFVSPQLIGVRTASTFSGFCQLHDSKTFAPIEQQSFVGTSEQCFLHSYRGLCREVFTKKAAFDSNIFMRDMDRGSPAEIQKTIQFIASEEKRGWAKGLSNILAIKRDFDDRLMNQKYDDINRCVFFFDRTPNIVCSGGFAPVYDLHGRQLQNLTDLSKPLEILFLTICATPSQGAAILTWLPNASEVCLEFVKSMWRLGNDEISNSLGRIAMEHLENTFFTPSWWESLPDPQKNVIIKHAMSGTLSPRDDHCLGNDCISYLNAKIVSVETNVADLE
ncbi:MAG: SEC-C domain-containing protein [Pseudomonadota bacterium]